MKCNDIIIRINTVSCQNSLNVNRLWYVCNKALFHMHRHPQLKEFSHSDRPKPDPDRSVYP